MITGPNHRTKLSLKKIDLKVTSVRVSVIKFVRNSGEESGVGIRIDHSPQAAVHLQGRKAMNTLKRELATVRVLRRSSRL